MTKSHEPLIDIHEAAARLQCSEKTIRRYVRSGVLKCYRPSRYHKMRFKWSEVEKALATGGEEAESILKIDRRLSQRRK